MNVTYNINLWFAKNENGEIVTIDKIDKDYEGKYYCPLCGSEVIPKATSSKMVTPHFAHIDRSRCSGESIVHYWTKNELVKKDDVIEIIADETRQVMIKDIEFEKSYDTPYGIYRPDITLTTYKNETVFVEVNYTNKKKAENYYLKWKHLKNIVLEFNVKNIYSEKDNSIFISNSFEAIYYDGLEFLIDKEDNEYTSYVKSLKVDSNKINELEWFIDDIYKYNNQLITIDEFTESVLSIIGEVKNEDFIIDVYKSRKCQNSIMGAIQYIECRLYDNVQKIVDSYTEIEVEVQRYSLKDNRYIYDRIFGDIKIELRIPEALELSIEDKHKKFRSEYSEYTESISESEFNKALDYDSTYYDWHSIDTGINLTELITKGFSNYEEEINHYLTLLSTTNDMSWIKKE